MTSNGQQHKTVVELTAHLLGEDYRTIVSHFERLRRKRNVFFYESTDTSSITEAKKATGTAKKLVAAIRQMIEKRDSQQRMPLH